ncbi:MAG: tRNA pseudouridine(54/55) synthase Pus10 [Planctomycetota bacterium]
MNRPPTTKVFVEGRYRKLCRDLPQTVFFCPQCKGHPRRRRKCTYCEGFGKLTRDSIQELVAWVLGKACQTRKNKFHGSGREDIDVRMLGRGRPFVMELIGPKRTDVDLAEVERTINERNQGRMEVEGLHWTEKARVRVLKEGKHAKRYRALVGIEGEVDAQRVENILGRRAQLAQQTPERVAHRRADKIRTRWIQLDQLEQVEPASDGRWELVVTAQHGTYVKEAISGEHARTQPSLGELLGGVTCTCVELDVLAILDEEGREELVPEALARPLTFGTGIESRE